MTDLSIVIVTWNARDVLLDALESIDREVRPRTDPGRITTETLVVDNGSVDGSARAVRERFPWVELIELPENLGFAAGNNVGLRRAKGRHALLLNSDTVVLPDALERCVRHLDATPEVGVVGLQLLNPDRTRQNCIHNFPSLLTEVVPKGILERLWPSRFPSKRFEHTRPIDVDAVLGACLFVRREVWEAVGLMPEEYFFFLEETDWCFVIRQAGWRIVHLPDAHVIHLFGASTKKKLPAATRIEYHRSLRKFFRRNRSPLSFHLIRALRPGKTLLSVVGGALPALFSPRARYRWLQNLRVLAWYARGRPLDWGLSHATKAKQGVAA